MAVEVPAAAGPGQGSAEGGRLATPRAAGRVVLLGAGAGFGLLLLAGAESRLGLGGLTALVSLVPTALALCVGGPPAAALASVVAASGGVLWLGPAAALGLLLRQAFPGLVLGAVVRRRLALPLALLVAEAAGLVGLVLLVWAYGPPGVGVVGLLERQVDLRLNDPVRWPAAWGGGAEAEWLAESARVAVALVRRAGPAIVVLSFFLVALANYLVVRLALRGPGFRPFAEEAVPDHLVWAVIAAGVMLVSREAWLERLGLNLLLGLAPLYAVQGLAVLRHFFQRARVPRALQGIGFGLFAVQPLLLVAAACLGLSDLWVDFRKLRRAPTPA